VRGGGGIWEKISEAEVWIGRSSGASEAGPAELRCLSDGRFKLGVMCVDRVPEGFGVDHCAPLPLGE
jgi:hypothetical protein